MEAESLIATSDSGAAAAYVAQGEQRTAALLFKHKQARDDTVRQVYL
jgi:hypothetical protein